MGTERLYDNRSGALMPDPLHPLCHHQPEAHVVYDKPGSGYRAELRCRCRKVLRHARKVRERVTEAEADGQALLAAL